MAKLADSEQTQGMLVQQLKKYKSLIATKQSKLVIIERELAERKKIIDTKQKIQADQLVSKCKADKEILVKLKHQAENLKEEHRRLKKQVLKEAQVVKEIDEELTQILEHHSVRKEWIAQEYELLLAEKRAYEVVLA